jgi:hypothetical protein
MLEGFALNQRVRLGTDSSPPARPGVGLNWNTPSLSQPVKEIGVG